MTCIACSGDGCVLCEGSGVTAEFVSFPSLLEKLHKASHTGPVILHFAQGSPNTVEIPPPPMRFRLDKRSGCA